jgi:hypothetical protein
MTLRADGISFDIEWDYTSFAVTGTLDGIEMLAPESC